MGADFAKLVYQIVRHRERVVQRHIDMRVMARIRAAHALQAGMPFLHAIVTTPTVIFPVVMTRRHFVDLEHHPRRYKSLAKKHSGARLP